MLSGGKGVLVIPPLNPKTEWQTVRLFSRALAVMLAKAELGRFDIVAVAPRLQPACPLMDSAGRAIELDGKMTARLEKQLKL